MTGRDGRCLFEGRFRQAREGFRLIKRNGTGCARPRALISCGCFVERQGELLAKTDQETAGRARLRRATSVQISALRRILDRGASEAAAPDNPVGY
jgi:hypothetical protein